MPAGFAAAWFPPRFPFIPHPSHNPRRTPMYYLTRSRGLRLAAQELPAGTCALVVAEMFYRFHSFTIECLAFLATWYVFSWVLSKAWQLTHHRRDVLPHVRLLSDYRERVG